MNLTALLLRALASGSDDDRLRVMAEVGRLIARRLRDAGMWNQPPDYFDYPEVPRWRDQFPPGADTDLQYGAAAPTVDFFFEKLEPALAKGALAAALADGRDVTGYVRCMVTNFLIDRQRRHDPVGSAVHGNLEAAVASLEADGLVTTGVKPGPRRKFRQDTRVRFTAAPGPDPPTAPVVVLVIEGPGLARGLHKLAKCARGAQRLLRGAIEALPGRGVDGFEFGPLLVALQQHVRDAVRVWNDPAPETLQPPDDGAGQNALRNRMAAAAAGYDSFDDLLETVGVRVRDAIDADGLQERTRTHLHRVLDDWLAHLAATGGEGPEHPPLEDWARRLTVKRSTLWDHLKRLRGYFRAALDQG